MSWINHLPPAYWSTFWKSIFKQQLGCRFDILDSTSSFLFILTYAIMYVLIHHITFWLYLYFLNIICFYFSSSLALTSSIDVVFLLSNRLSLTSNMKRSWQIILEKCILDTDDISDDVTVIRNILDSTCFYPRPVLAFGYCHRLYVCVCLSVLQPFCPGDNSSHVPARIIQFGPKKFNKFSLRSLLFLAFIDLDLPGQI